MKVERITDGAKGWAIQFAGIVVFQARRWPAGTYITEIEGIRSAYSPRLFESTFMPSAGGGR